MSENDPASAKTSSTKGRRQSPLHRKKSGTGLPLWIGFGVVIAFFVASGFLSYAKVTTLRQNALSVAHSHDVMMAVSDIVSLMKDAETGQRGYLLTGNEIYLSPYDVAKSRAQRQLATLAQLLAPHPESDTPMQRLTALITEKFDEVDQTVTLKRAGHDQEAMAIILSNKGKTLMDEANVFFSGIIRQADERLTAGVLEQQTNAGRLRLVSALGGLVIIAVVGGAAIVLIRYTRELRVARDELNALNAGLEQRVSERTADLEASRDRAQVLVSEVNHRVANSLAMVSSFISLQSKQLNDPVAKKALSETQDRIFAISLVHKRLYGAGDVREVNLAEYLTSLLDHLQSSLRGAVQGVSLVYELEPVRLKTDASVNLAVVVTEWVTNAFKYAYPEGAGQIRVLLRQAPDGEVELQVEDDGVGRSEGSPAKGTGLGTRIVTAMAASLGGTVEYRANHPGTAACLAFMPKADAGVAGQ